MTAPTGEHEVSMDIHLHVFYPDHAIPRSAANTRIFDATKAHWHKSGCTCVVCGTKDHIEIHHKHIEWADAEGVDWSKVRAEHPDFDWSTFSEPADFIDSVYNTEPLCELHHRGPAPHGKHFTPEPIWNMQKYKLASFVYACDEVST